MPARKKLLVKGGRVKKGMTVKGIDPDSGEITFYIVEQVWGSHAVMRVISEAEAGQRVVSLALENDSV